MLNTNKDSNNNKRIFLCIDIGTSSMKAALINECGLVLNTTRVKLQTNFNQNLSLSNQHPWLEAFYTACQNLNTISVNNLQAISISGNGPTLVATGNYFTHTLLWNKKPVKPIPYNGISIFIPRILTFREEFPELWNKTEQIFSGPEYLVFLLTKKQITSLPQDRFLPAYWTQNELDQLQIHRKLLPDFTEPTTQIGNLLPEIASKITLNPECKIFCSGPDFITALVGTNTLINGKVCDRSGSSEGINLCTNTPIKESGIRTLPSIISNYFNASILLQDTGTRFSEWKNNSIWKDSSFIECIQELRLQKNNFGYKLMLNITNEVKKAFIQIEQIRKTLTDSTIQIYCTGGQAKNPEWMQIKSDITGFPLYITNCPDSELMGDAIIAATGLKIYHSITESAENLVKLDKVYYPKKFT